MSDRKIGYICTNGIILEDTAIAYAACHGAPASIKEGAVVSMAEALEHCVHVLGMDCENVFDSAQASKEARAALAMYYGENQ